jgi:hypothetical protein
MLKRTESASEVAGQSATGQVTSDKRRCPSHDGRAAMLKIPFPEPLSSGDSTVGMIDSLQQDQRFTGL